MTLQRKTPLRRPGWARKRTVRPGWAAARSQRLALALHLCEVMVPGVCTGEAHHVHHRLRRSQGGTDDFANLLAVCPACHSWVHDHPADSYANGWLIRSGGDHA